jgi:hypothetical protein|tara:strand:- start:603 stop:1247 length:645 start_codon:yes stop_codon:yes gene_type:complete
MKAIDGPYNPELMTMLNGFSEWFVSHPMLDKLPVGGTVDLDHKYTSARHLKERQTKDYKTDKTAEGYPNNTHGIDLIRSNHMLPEDMRQPCKTINQKLNSWFGSKFCAVMMYYPPGGYMDWHNNANCPGYNTLISYSETGDGWFKFQDPITKEFHKMKDKSGWTVKAGYFGSWKEPDKIYWHCASTKTHRITFGYVIPDENMWNMMIDDIIDVE